jgi:SpoVK/Ycf46/Vps4 family AAA+-type ATPase
MDVPVVVIAVDPLSLGHSSVAIEVRRPDRTEQRALWRAVLNGSAGPDIDEATMQFDLGYTDIADNAGTPVVEGGLWALCRVRSRSRLDELARRVEPRASWRDLVLPADQTALLHDITAQVRGRSRVYHDWGFERASTRGLGIGALFSGPSGTGKTFAAEVIAGELALDLYVVDLSAVVSKYIGETEKNLRAVFDEADKGGAVLLFDEADALFGKRTEVRDSHDRYANIEVSYLLQRMENYRGLAVLTTNLRSSMDQAFLRRLRFVVNFPFPDPVQRAEIWRRVFPSEVPTRGLDPARLAQLNVAGGNIRNIALTAAFLAADADEPVTMTHVLRATRGEYAKADRPLTTVETGGWPA